MRTKTKKADLEGKKFLFLQLGVIVALGLSLVAFEWESKANLDNLTVEQKVVDFTWVDIPNTRPKDITPPPPPLVVIPEAIRIHPDEVKLPPSDPDIFIDIVPTNIKFYTQTEEPLVDEEPIPFPLIEEKPTFQGGDYNTFSIWVAKQLKYPEDAARAGVSGRVMVQFLIDADGSIKNITVVGKRDKMLEEEALRVIALSPKWEPGRQRGKATPVLFTFPVTFRLQ